MPVIQTGSTSNPHVLKTRASLRHALAGLADIPLCSDVSPAPGFVGPIQCIDSSGATSSYSGPYPATQSQVADISLQLQQQQSQQQTSQTQNSAALILLAVAIGALAILR